MIVVSVIDSSQLGIGIDRVQSIEVVIASPNIKDTASGGKALRFDIGEEVAERFHYGNPRRRHRPRRQRVQLA